MKQENQNKIASARTPRSERHNLNVFSNSIDKATLDQAHDAWIISLFERKALYDIRYPIVIDPGADFWTSAEKAAHYKDHLYMVTMLLKSDRFTASDAFAFYDAGPIFAAFKAWYLNTCALLLGRRYAKKPKTQPFTLAFLDVEGTRIAKPAGAFQIPHIHAVMLAHPETRLELRALIASGKARCFPHPLISKIEIVPFQNDGRGADPMLTYASKFARISQRNGRLEDSLRVFPDIRADCYPFYGNQSALGCRTGMKQNC
jgi:hypothetical protein